MLIRVGISFTIDRQRTQRVSQIAIRWIEYANKPSTSPHWQQRYRSCHETYAFKYHLKIEPSGFPSSIPSSVLVLASNSLKMPTGTSTSKRGAANQLSVMAEWSCTKAFYTFTQCCFYPPSLSCSSERIVRRHYQSRSLCQSNLVTFHMTTRDNIICNCRKQETNNRSNALHSLQIASICLI